MTVVAYPGPAGSHTGAAAAALHPRAQLHAVGGFRAVADAVVQADAAHGVLPIESSLAGAVNETHDLLHEGAISIVAEAVLPIRHCLLARDPIALEEIRVVRSHPSALEQCRRLLDRLPNAAVVPASTTADAARETAESGDPTAVAIAGPEAASLYGLVTLQDDVGDGPAFTRFVSVAPYTWLGAGRTEARTAFTFVTDHRPGALHAAITPFAEAGLDLVRLVSRPLPQTPFSYRFDAVVAGHPLDAKVRQALAELAALTSSRRIVGVYEGVEQ
ncbi:MAG TPA: prephenate dehydratase domain-containing protein [Gaiellaceae bacterium]|nr:prephenate dehydratase domain-containing protein [Gaiellaceae bacterium]